MPDHELHGLTRGIYDKLMGKNYGYVDKLMDAPVKTLGRKHRVLFHDPLQLMLLFAGKPDELLAATIHLILDTHIRTKRQKELLKAVLKAMK